MMRIITSFAVILLLSAAAYAQPVWEVQNPSPLRLNTLGVQCFDSSTAYVLTTDGYFMKTTDRGNTWKEYSNNFTNAVHGMSFPSKDTGFIVCDYGVILKTIDGGTTWIQLQSGVTDVIAAVAFLDDQTGFAVYNDANLFTSRFLKTTNGGITWSKSDLPCNTQGYCYSKILCRKNYIVLAGNELLFSNNQGDAWQSPYGWRDGPYYDLSFIGDIDTEVIVVGGSGLMLHADIASDSINWWQGNPPAYTNNYIGIAFIDNDTGCIAGGSPGIILRTTDGSATWKSDSIGINNNLNKISFGLGGWGMCIGDGVILTTTNAGKNWINITPASVTANLYDVSFFNANTGTAVGDSGVILHTTNGGVQWIQQNTNVNNHFSKVAQIDSLNAMVVGDSGIIIRTSDGGTSWRRTLDTILLHITALRFRNDKQGIALGDSGIILLTSDGGYTWKRYEYNYGSNAEVLYASDSLLFSCCSPTMRSVDGGKTWKAFTESLYHDGYMPEQNISAIGLDENLNLYLGGSGYWGTVPHYQGYQSISLYQSVDSGSTWEYYFDNTWETFSSTYPDPRMIKIGFVYGSTCIAFDNERQMYVGNGGSAWSVGACPVPYQVNAISTPDDSTFYAVGNYGSIIKLKNIQILTAVQEIVAPPMFFTLSQNYPNPAIASSTTINYSLEKASNVSLKVYTILGEQVAVPVVGWQSAGAHSVTLDCSSLSQGVYFYTLSQDGSAQTKMMVVKR
jgi:photosystem II stability/assembly factor-like uncharacterized protein